MLVGETLLIDDWGEVFPRNGFGVVGPNIKFRCLVEGVRGDHVGVFCPNTFPYVVFRFGVCVEEQGGLVSGRFPGTGVIGCCAGVIKEGLARVEAVDRPVVC